ncbi:MAG: hypothetical protein D6719_09305 [Candidatus Dadabacteria bacterium]|nr:MAG: hypothetical protein D6719_09305 [Candidatus Dadabacteria bacterium]
MLLTACAAKKPPEAPVAFQDSDSAQPFAVKILDEINDGRNLRVIGSISADRPWNPDNVVVRLVGLGQGQEKAENVFALSERKKSEKSSAGNIGAGEPVSFVLSVPASGLSDYQLEVLWGEDAAPYLKKESALLEVRNLSYGIKPCASKQNCDDSYVLEGELVNTGKKLVTAARLGLAFYGGGDKLDLSGKVPENEQIIKLAGINLAPGELQPLRLVLEEKPPADAVKLKPRLRVISVSTD